MPEWLSGWKKIATYLDVSISTAKLMKRRGLPVYNKQGMVKAKPIEIDNFIKSGKNSQNRPT
ncbi:MAG: hypothetical protein PHS93_09380 [Candidatus Omnitrophica bacterium]|nr:hypothetical protein [Candidatus Omnitrophota bacterium]